MHLANKSVQRVRRFTIGQKTRTIDTEDKQIKGKWAYHWYFTSLLGYTDGFEGLVDEIANSHTPINLQVESSQMVVEKLEPNKSSDQVNKRKRVQSAYRRGNIRTTTI